MIYLGADISLTLTYTYLSYLCCGLPGRPRVDTYLCKKQRRATPNRLHSTTSTTLINSLRASRSHARSSPGATNSALAFIPPKPKELHNAARSGRPASGALPSLTCSKPRPAGSGVSRLSVSPTPALSLPPFLSRWRLSSQCSPSRAASYRPRSI